MKWHPDLATASIAFGQAGQAPKLLTVGTEPGTMMPYYSLSKPLTAAAILAQVEAGTMRLDDAFAGATIRQLLQHTGGWDATEAGRSSRSTRCRSPLHRPARSSAPVRPRYALRLFEHRLLSAWRRVLKEATGLSYEEAVRASFPEAEAMDYDGLLGPAGGWSGNAVTFHRFASRPIPPVVTVGLVPRPGDTPYGLGWGVD